MTAADSNISSFVRIIDEAFAGVLSQVQSAKWESSCDDTVDQGAKDRSTTKVGVSLEKGLEGNFSFAFTAETGVALANALTGDSATAVEGKISGDQLEAVQELLRQVLGIVASSLKPTFGEVTTSLLETAPEAVGGICRGLKLKSATDSYVIFVNIEEGLQRALENSAKKDAAATKKPDATQDAAMVSKPTMLQEYLQERNFNLLLDVELAVALRFGKREMLMKDILELSSGSVVELDRLVKEPVDLLVDHKIVARGEVVIVDGNYGLRISEVATPQQRIDCL